MPTAFSTTLEAPALWVGSVTAPGGIYEPDQMTSSVQAQAPIVVRVEVDLGVKLEVDQQHKLHILNP